MNGTERILYFLRATKFVARKYLKGYTVNPYPAFDAEGTRFFFSAIKNTRIYLEFGAGGSTIVASKHVARLVSVETDHVFAEAVLRALSPSNGEVRILTPDIGVTRDWGYPIFGRPTPNRIARWKQIPKAPWDILGQDVPDTILIDSRMRVACALESLLHISPKTRLLIDDYVGRSYAAVEEFATLVAFHGTMAEFRKREVFDEVACARVIKLAYSDMR